MKSTTSNICAVLGSIFIIGCMTSTPVYDEDPMAHVVFKGRSVVEKMADDDIGVNGAESMAAMKKERKMLIAVDADISFQFQKERNGLNVGKYIDEGKIRTSAELLARTFCERVKAYKLVYIDKSDINRTLKTSDDINGMTFPFLCNLRPIFTSESVEDEYDYLQIYKCVLQWELIDNRTTSNGLGSNPKPVVVESMTCQNVAKRRRPASVSGAALGGDEEANAQNAYNEALGNCLLQYYAQLANRIPFGGVVSEIKALDDDLYVKIKADYRGQGVQEKMQMLIINEDNDRVAVGEVLVSANGKSNIKISRWLSKSYRKQIESVAKKGKDAVEGWLDENPLYALCLGLPEWPKDLMRDFRSRK